MCVSYVTGCTSYSRSRFGRGFLLRTLPPTPFPVSCDTCFIFLEAIGFCDKCRHRAILKTLASRYTPPPKNRDGASLFQTPINTYMQFPEFQIEHDGWEHICNAGNMLSTDCGILIHMYIRTNNNLTWYINV